MRQPAKKPPTCECTRFADHWEFAPRMKWSESSDDPATDGAEDADLY